MSGSTSIGGDGYRPLFTAVQWQELEHQALIYKYLVAGVPVPYDLVMPIKRSFEALSATLFHHHNQTSLNFHQAANYSSCYGKKYDPEPGRCRRTDGKKWRCSKDAYHESKYCERHMHRGRNRSRKPVESQSLSTAISTISNVSTTGSVKRSYQNLSNAGSTNQSVYPITNSESFDFGRNVSKLQVDTGPYVINNKDLRYSQGLTNDQSYTSGNVRDFGMNANIDSSSRLMASQNPTNSLLLKPQNDSYLQLNMADTFDPMVDTTLKQRQQYPFFGGEIVQVKNEQPMRTYLWSNLDNATTQLSMSMDPEFNARNDCSSNDAA